MPDKLIMVPIRLTAAHMGCRLTKTQATAKGDNGEYNKINLSGCHIQCPEPPGRSPRKCHGADHQGPAGSLCLQPGNPWDPNPESVLFDNKSRRASSTMMAFLVSARIASHGHFHTEPAINTEQKVNIEPLGVSMCPSSAPSATISIQLAGQAVEHVAGHTAWIPVRTFHQPVLRTVVLGEWA